jgi:hypothetical protein
MVVDCNVLQQLGAEVQWCSASAQTTEASNAVAAAVTANSTAVTVHTHEVSTHAIPVHFAFADTCSTASMLSQFAALNLTSWRITHIFYASVSAMYQKCNYT